MMMRQDSPHSNIGRESQRVLSIPGRDILPQQLWPALLLGTLFRYPKCLYRDNKPVHYLAISTKINWKTTKQFGIWPWLAELQMANIDQVICHSLLVVTLVITPRQRLCVCVYMAYQRSITHKITSWYWLYTNVIRMSILSQHSLYKVKNMYFRIK